MSFTNNRSKLTGKSTTNAFNVNADNITVEKNELIKGDLTVLGTTNIGNVTLENGTVNNLTVGNLTVNPPIPTSSGGTGLSTIGSPNQVLTVNPAGTGLFYQAFGLTNPSTITGTGFTGTPTFNFGIEASGPTNGRGFIRTSAAATELILGTTTSSVLRLSGSGGSANFTYNSTGTSGIFDVTNAGGAITFTNSNSGVISMATSGLTGSIGLSTSNGALSLGVLTSSLTMATGTLNIGVGLGALTLTTGGGPISMNSFAGNTTIETGTGILTLQTAAAGAVNIGAAGVGATNMYGSAVSIFAPVIVIGGGLLPTAVLSAVTIACGVVNATTGAFGLQTADCNISSLASITLQTLVGTITLNGTNTTMNGKTTITSSTTPLEMNMTGTTGVPGISLLQPNAGNFAIAMLFGKSAALNLSATIRFNNNNTVPSDNNLGFGFYANDDLYKITVLGTHIWRNTTAETMVLTNTGTLLLTGVLNVTNTATTSTSIGTFFNPNLATGEANYLMLGRSTASNESLHMQYSHNTTVANRSFSMYFSGSGATQITMQNNGTISLTGSTSINGNVLVSQNINWGVLTVNTNTALTVNSAKTILVRGGSGVTITLPNATTLTVGWNYIINNNSGNTVTINTFTSTIVTNVLAGQLCNVYLLTNPNTTGTWDFHITGTVGSVNSVTATSPILSSGGSSPDISISPTAPISLGPVTITSLTQPLSINMTGSTGIPAISVYQPNAGNFAIALVIGKQADTNAAATIRFNNNNATPNDRNVGFGFFANDDLYKITVLGTHVWRNTTAETMVLTNTGTLALTGVLNVANTATTSTFIGTFFNPNLATGQANYLMLGRSTASNESLYMQYSHNTTVANRSFSMYFSGSGATQISMQNNGTISLTGATTINGVTTINTSTTPLLMNVSGTTGGQVFKCLKTSLGDTDQVLLWGKAEATNQSTVIRFLNNNTTPTINYLGFGFYGNDDLYKIFALGSHIWKNTTAETMRLASNGDFFNYDPAAGVENFSTTSGTSGSVNLSGFVTFKSRGTNFYGSPTQYCTIGCSNPTTSGDESLDMAFMYLGRKISEQSVRFSYKNNTVYRNWSFGMGITGNQDLFGIWSTTGGNQCCFGDINQMPTVPNGIVNISSRAGNNQVMTFYNPSNAVGSIVVGIGVTSFNSSSDYRLKENIVPMENTLQKVLLLNPVSHTWKLNNAPGYGFIAHELQEIFPTCVIGEKDALNASGEIISQMIDYGKLTPFLTAAIKDLYSLVQTLQARITVLESQ